MAVRVKVKLKSPEGLQLEAVAILNGGFESEEPAILLSYAAAKRLFSQFPEDAETITGEAAAGEEEFLALPQKLAARLITPDREEPPVECVVYVARDARELLLSDSAIDDLHVKIESFREGHWRFSDEQAIRESEEPQRW